MQASPRPGRHPARPKRYGLKRYRPMMRRLVSSRRWFSPSANPILPTPSILLATDTWHAFPMSTFLLPTSLSNLVATTIGISIIHQRRWSNAYWCCRTRLVSGVGKACAGDSPGNCHPHPGRCEALARSCRGYPIWREQAPRLINTFIESHNLKGKTVIPFATSGGSTISGIAATLKRSYPALEWKEGCLLNRTDEKTVRTWIDRLGY